jgi:antitoxin component YwqK of YwqJK toxin-antitoxin module
MSYTRYYNPLFSLFENGHYQLSYYNASKRAIQTAASGGESKPDERRWHVVYPKEVDRSRITELKLRCKWDGDLINYTSSFIYDSGNAYIYVATRPSSEINSDRVKFFEDEIKAGKRPFVIFMTAYFQSSYDYSNDFVLDGHHKLYAYQNLGIEPPRVTITHNFHASDKPEFDLEALTEQLYPWQSKHILDNWDDDDAYIAEMQNHGDSALHSLTKNGKVEEYYPNKKIRSEAFYVNYKLDGKVSEWYDNGQLKHEYHYKNGLQVGFCQEWFSSGGIKATYEYDNKGQIHGKSVTYFESGKLRSEYYFENGRHADGYGFSRWWHTQNMQVEHWYENNIVVARKTYSDDGVLVSKEYYDAVKRQLVREPVKRTYNTDGEFAHGSPEKNLNIIRERQYPETSDIFTWRTFAIILFVLVQLLRMCK